MINSIKEIVVVEGKTDTLKLKSLFNSILTFETNGNKISQKKINALKIINQKKGIICFLDPDGTGKAIRQKIIDQIPDAKHAFIDKKTIAKNSKKIGIAEANDYEIEKALSNLITFQSNNDSLSWQEYLSLNLNSNLKRKVVSDYFKIENYNHKQLFKILNYMNVSYEDLLKIKGTWVEK